MKYSMTAFGRFASDDRNVIHEYEVVDLFRNSLDILFASSDKSGRNRKSLDFELSDFAQSQFSIGLYLLYCYVLLSIPLTFDLRHHRRYKIVARHVRVAHLNDLSFAWRRSQLTNIYIRRSGTETLWKMNRSSVVVHLVLISRRAVKRVLQKWQTHRQIGCMVAIPPNFPLLHNNLAKMKRKRLETS